ncbi:diguanylate cyclase domain-containing protein [Thermodesulfobacteriota bacterium]
MAERSGHPRVLIVDDSAENLKILGQSIDELCQVLVARDGEKALELAASTNAPDLILLDILMPGMDGYEVCRRLKADDRTRGIPVLFVTSLSHVEDEARGLALGAIDYITKPISRAIVRARVKNHLELKRKNDLLDRLSSIDSLTCIANRRLFDETLDKEWRRAVRANTPISLIMMDVDFFKAYNDHYGHVAGDECLKMVAQALQLCFARSSDLLARFGGEEFAAILPGVERKHAIRASKRARRQIRALEIVHAYSPVADIVTISIGAASIAPARGSSPTLLLKAADKMLYRAKNRGRDQVRACAVQSD